MKQIFLLTLLITLIYSCSSDEQSVDADKKIDTNLLVSKSPWTYHSFILIKILDKKNKESPEEYIQKTTTRFFLNSTYSFYKDGTGIFALSQEGSFKFKWKIENDKDLIINYGHINGDKDIYIENLKNVTVDSNFFEYDFSEYDFDVDHLSRYKFE